MAIVATSLDSGDPTGSSFTTASVNYTGGLLLLSFTFNNTAVTVNSVTGLGLTWVLVQTSALSTLSIVTYRAMGTPTTGSVTVNFSGGSTTATVYMLDQLSGVNTGGTNGSGAIAQAVAGNDTTGTFSIALSPVTAGNATYGALGAEAVSAPTPGSGYSNITISPVLSGFLIGGTEFKAAGASPVNWTVASGSTRGIGFEIVAGAAPTLSTLIYFAASLIAANYASYSPWTYQYQGNAQPYAQAQLNPSITAVPVNPPPPQDPASSAQGIALGVQASQPDPWQYNSLGQGAMGPYLPPRNPVAVIGIPVNNPPFNQRTLGASDVIYAWQPDPWIYNYNGPVSGRQPYGQRQLNPSIIAVPVSNPPFGIPNIPTLSVVVGQWQPDAWPPVFMGNRQAYQGRQLTPGIPGQSVDNPPGIRTQEQTASTIVDAWKADPWPPVFDGNLQAYQGRTLSPGIPGQSVDNPPYQQPGRTPAQMAVVSQQQPDPWQYTFLGGAGPFYPRQVTPDEPGTSVDNPPFRNPGRIPQAMVPISAWQPEVWPYTFMGNAQPYMGKKLPPVIEAVPIQINYRLTVRNVIVRLGYVQGGGSKPATYPPNNQG